MSDAQRNQVYQGAEAAGWRCYSAWVNSLDLASLDYKSLPHSGMQGDYEPPDGANLSQSVADASLIIGGLVASIAPDSQGFGTVVNIQVTTVIKGQVPAATISFREVSHLEPLNHWNGVLVVDADNAPLLLPGESVYLLLKQTSDGYYVESFTGTYLVKGEVIEALPSNPYGGQLNGETTTQFASALANA